MGARLSRHAHYALAVLASAGAAMALQDCLKTSNLIKRLRTALMRMPEYAP
ncbi:hypothetical protein C4J88_5356 [Pseudomonas sp. R4-39-08]|nr:hypothetical protein C4J88_5356 [Pseudomonas sp. R4-39-08]